MSLSIYLYDEHGEEVVDLPCLGITHNLGKMASEVGKVDSDATLYNILWRPDEYFSFDNGHIPVDYVLKRLPDLIYQLVIDKDRLSLFSPENGWGNYQGLLDFSLNYYKACYNNPNSFIYCCR